MYNIIIIGMGISGITAAIYAKRSNKKVLLIDKGTPGGLLNKIDKISNYPGLIDISGPEFADILEKQVKSFDIPYILEEVIDIDLEKKIVKTKNNQYEGTKIILAMGRKPKYLGLDNEQELIGKGVSSCALCDAFFYKDKNVAVVGTGNSALSEALYLANIASLVYIINRRDGFRGEDMLVQEIKNNPKIKIIYNANIISILVDGVFIYIGNKPATEFIDKKILDGDGYVKVNEKFETEIPGIYAIGDIIKKDVYQLVTAASDGARVIYNMK